MRLSFASIYYSLLLFLCLSQDALCGTTSTSIRETAEYIATKFGRGAAGHSIEGLTDATTKVVARHGEGALPFLRNSGYAGFAALEEAGAKAPEVIKLYARRGDEAIWVISEPKKLAIFIKHGDSAADALLKYPGIADNLIGRYGDDAVGALKGLSRRSAQRLNIVADEGLLAANPRSTELLPVVRQYGDQAMDFIWKNKGSLAVGSVLATFLADPKSYFSGAKDLLVEPILNPVVQNANWTLIIAGVLLVVFLPFVARSFSRAYSAIKSKMKST